MPYCQINNHHKTKKIPVTTDDELYELAISIVTDYKAKSLLVPDSSFYPLKPTYESAELVLGRLFRHIGLKHSSLSLHIAPDEEAYYVYSHTTTPTITLGIDVLENPFTMAAAVTHMFCHYLLDSRHHLTTSDPVMLEKLVDILTIELGFGIIMLNGYSAGPNLPTSTTLTWYADQLSKYLYRNRIVSSYWIDAALDDTAHLLNTVPSVSPIQAVVVHSAAKSRRIWKILSVIAVSVFLIVSAVVLHQAANARNEELVQQKDSLRVQILQKQYELCKDKFLYQSDSWPDDVFIDRNVEEQAQKCREIRAEHKQLTKQ